MLHFDLFEMSAKRFEWCLELFQTSIGVSRRRANFAKERGTSNL
jgi:hypothetical protein